MCVCVRERKRKKERKEEEKEQEKEKDEPVAGLVSVSPFLTDPRERKKQ